MTDFNKLKVADLRAELKKRGLPQAGLKPVLVARLEAAENEDGSESETTVQGDLAKLDTASAASPDTVSPILPSPDASLATFPDLPLESTTESGETTTQAVEQESTRDTFAQSTPALAGVEEISSEQTQATDTRDDQSALPSVEPQEAIDDRQKRKRRSESPSLSATDVARKRFRPSIGTAEDGEGDKESTPKEDAEWVGKHNAADTEEMDTSETVEAKGQESTIVDTEMNDVKMEIAVETIDQQSDPETKNEGEGAPGDAPANQRDSRFKGLFGGDSTQDEPMVDAYDPELEQDRSIAPAIHPATSALYIRDLMRPLNPATLKGHITSLAAAPGNESDPDVILEFHIDQIRTHAFVSLTSVSAASRVRSALHDRIWPDEKTRKPLWIDFVPVDKVTEWIEIEQAANPGRTIGKKWEVVYDMDQERSVTAALQEVTNIPRHNSFQKQSFSAPVPIKTPIERRFSEDRTRPLTQGRSSAGPQPAPFASNHSRLNDLFDRTTAKPVLYFKPVSRDIVNKRLDALDAAISKKVAPSELLDGPVNRYTFEADQLVDRGPEIFPGLRPPPGFRGPAFGDGSSGRNRGDRGGRGDRGSYDRGNRSSYGNRGGYGGDSYRSSDRRGHGGDRGDRSGYSQGRDSYRGGQQERRYDSYRGERRNSGSYERR